MRRIAWEFRTGIAGQYCKWVDCPGIRALTVGRCLAIVACSWFVFLLSECVRPANLDANLLEAAYPSQRCVEITDRPVVVHIDEGSAVIWWDTDVASSSVVRYGTSPAELEQSAKQPGSSTRHSVHLVNLRSHTSYYFRAESACSGKDPTISQLGTFTTSLEPPGPDGPETRDYWCYNAADHLGDAMMIWRDALRLMHGSKFAGHCSSRGLRTIHQCSSHPVEQLLITSKSVLPGSTTDFPNHMSGRPRH
jgi:hypothetical protein